MTTALENPLLNKVSFLSADHGGNTIVDCILEVEKRVEIPGSYRDNIQIAEASAFQMVANDIYGGVWELAHEAAECVRSGDEQRFSQILAELATYGT